MTSLSLSLNFGNDMNGSTARSLLNICYVVVAYLARGYEKSICDYYLQHVALFKTSPLIAYAV